MADDPPPPPPQLSPLSGAYLLIVVGEPFSEEHKQLILNKIRQGRSVVIGKNIREESQYLLKSSRYLVVGGGGGMYRSVFPHWPHPRIWSDKLTGRWRARGINCVNYGPEDPKSQVLKADQFVCCIASGESNRDKIES